MANRKFQQFQYSLEREVVKLYAKFTPDQTGTSGSCTKSYGFGISAINKVSTGRFQIVLEDKYNKLLNIDATPVKSTYASNIKKQVVTESVASAGTIDLGFTNGSALANPGTDEPFLLEITLRNSGIGG